MDSSESSKVRSEQKSRKFLKSLIRRHPWDLLVIGTGVSAAIAPGIPVRSAVGGAVSRLLLKQLSSWRFFTQQILLIFIKVIKDRDLLVVAHDLIWKLSPILQWARGHIKYGVLHIHGLCTDPCGMILDPSGYKDVTQDTEVMWGIGGFVFALTQKIAGTSCVDCAKRKLENHIDSLKWIKQSDNGTPTTS